MKQFVRTQNGKIYRSKYITVMPDGRTIYRYNTEDMETITIVKESDNLFDLVFVGDFVRDSKSNKIYTFTTEIDLRSIDTIKYVVDEIYTKQYDDYCLVARKTDDKVWKLQYGN